MTKVGVDTPHFTAHSTRVASTSAAVRAVVPIQTILKAACWTNEHTFHKIYEKCIQTTELKVDDIFNRSIQNN